MNHGLVKKSKALAIGIGLGLTVGAVPVPASSAMTLSQSPLFVTATAHPNIMLLIDNSGSMSNVVPDSPYDPSSTPSSLDCPSSLYVADSFEIDIRITSAGVPYFRAGTYYSGTTYDWGITNSSGGGRTGLSERCFNPTATYKARLVGDSGSSTKSPGSYLGASYTGHFLNWYFGSKSSWGSGAESYPDSNIQQRIAIARTATTNLVDSLGNVRLGLATYNDGAKGAKILYPIKDLTSGTKTQLDSAIGGLAPSGSTPLAESLNDIIRYYIGIPGGNDPDLTLPTDGNTYSASTIFAGTGATDSPTFDSSISSSDKDSPIQVGARRTTPYL